MGRETRNFLHQALALALEAGDWPRVKGCTLTMEQMDGDLLRDRCIWVTAILALAGSEDPFSWQQLRGAGVLASRPSKRRMDQ
jgi:hypothetical protein